MSKSAKYKRYATLQSLEFDSGIKFNKDGGIECLDMKFIGMEDVVFNPIHIASMCPNLQPTGQKSVIHLMSGIIILSPLTLSEIEAEITKQCGNSWLKK